MYFLLTFSCSHVMYVLLDNSALRLLMILIESLLDFLHFLKNTILLDIGVGFVLIIALKGLHNSRIDAIYNPTTHRVFFFAQVPEGLLNIIIILLVSHLNDLVNEDRGDSNHSGPPLYTGLQLIPQFKLFSLLVEMVDVLFGADVK
jgi:hypothetical protein